MEPDDRDRPVEEENPGNKRVSYACMIAGLAGVFFFGSYFELFGQPIVFDNLGIYLFYGSIWLGCFGALVRFMHWRTAFAGTVIVSGLFLVIFVAGGIARGAF